MIEVISKEEYIEPFLEIIEFESQDIITTSSYKDKGQLEWDELY